MADWQLTNFTRLADKGPSEDLQWRFGRSALGARELGVSRFTYGPGARMPFAHSHHEQEEVYVVVSGSGRAWLDGEIVDLAVWDALRVSPQVMRSMQAGPDGLDVICIGGRKPSGSDNVRGDDPW